MWRKVSIIAIIVFCFLPFTNCYAQGNSNGKWPSTKTMTIDFYRCLLNNISPIKYTPYPEIEYRIWDTKDILTQGYSLSEIEKVVKKAKVFTDGEWLDSIIEISFPNKNIVYLEYTELTLNRIWLPDGTDAFTPTWHFYRPGIINDSDGYVNIREKPSVNSKIVGRINKDELFYFIPVSRADWYQICWEEGDLPVGYIHKSRITTYDDFPKKIKEKVKTLRSGC